MDCRHGPTPSVQRTLPSQHRRHLICRPARSWTARPPRARPGSAAAPPPTATRPKEPDGARTAIPAASEGRGQRTQFAAVPCAGLCGRSRRGRRPRPAPPAPGCAPARTSASSPSRARTAACGPGASHGAPLSGSPPSWNRPGTQHTPGSPGHKPGCRLGISRTRTRSSQAYRCRPGSPPAPPAQGTPPAPGIQH